VLVHFGDGDFAAKYQTLLENIGQWQATAGNIRTVDLRFNREAVVNADNASKTAKQAKAQFRPQQSKPQQSKPQQKVPQEAAREGAQTN
jgi:hypothetical protein